MTLFHIMLSVLHLYCKQHGERDGEEAALSDVNRLMTFKTKWGKCRLWCIFSHLMWAYLCCSFEKACKCIWFRLATSLTLSLLHMRLTFCCENGSRAAKKNPTRELGVGVTDSNTTNLCYHLESCTVRRESMNESHMCHLLLYYLYRFLYFIHNILLHA